MRIALANDQRDAKVDAARMGRLARRAARALKITAQGTIAITFISRQRMRRLNKQFLRHDWDTDVLSFRYEAGAPVVGEILIAPGMAQSYARRHGLAYGEELARYVVHGLLHWLGHDDRTAEEQRQMRRRENRVLSACGITPSVNGH